MKLSAFRSLIPLTSRVPQRTRGPASKEPTIACGAVGGYAAVPGRLRLKRYEVGGASGCEAGTCQTSCGTRPQRSEQEHRRQ